MAAGTPRPRNRGRAGPARRRRTSSSRGCPTASDTVIGRAGTRLSGGQPASGLCRFARRGCLKDAPILPAREAGPRPSTTETSGWVQTAKLERLMRGRTTLGGGAPPLDREGCDRIPRHRTAAGCRSRRQPLASCIAAAALCPLWVAFKPRGRAPRGRGRGVRRRTRGAITRGLRSDRRRPKVPAPAPGRPSPSRAQGAAQFVGQALGQRDGAIRAPQPLLRRDRSH